jgi:hypothetical protein
MTLAVIACLPQRHCEERSDEAIQSHGFPASAAALNSHASFAMTAQE